MILAVLLATLLGVASPRYHDLPVHPVSLAQLTNDTRGTPDPAEHTIAYWRNHSLSTVRDHLRQVQRNQAAKNLIIFLGDGMSMATVTAARIYLGQLSGRPGEEERLSFEKFPYTGLSKTYCVDSQVADSACSATAYLCGVKTNIRTIGVTADVKYQDWQNQLRTEYHTPSILQWAQEAGKGTGIVTTCRVTDASPTGTYAHIASRWWQTDQDIKRDAPAATGVADITMQLVESYPGNNIKVILGGGREVFLPREQQDEYGFNGTRGDGKDLIREWKDKKVNHNNSYVTNLDQLQAVDVNNTEYLLGLFHHNHMDYHLHAGSSQPTLADMTRAAIRMMQKEVNGYFLFIEGGRIDHGHHDNQAHLSLDEAVEFHKAIELAASMTSEEDTLIVVTADHAHTMTLNGYPSRGSDIFTTLQAAQGNLSYSTLSYANGPNKNGYSEDGTRRNIMDDDRGNPNYTFPTIFQLDSETHDGQDVAVFARGPGAHLLVGNYEQTVIPHVMAYAARIGPAADLEDYSGGDSSGAAPAATLTAILAAVLASASTLV